MELKVAAIDLHKIKCSAEELDQKAFIHKDMGKVLNGVGSYV